MDPKTGTWWDNLKVEYHRRRHTVRRWLLGEEGWDLGAGRPPNDLVCSPPILVGRTQAINPDGTPISHVSIWLRFAAEGQVVELWERVVEPGMDDNRAALVIPITAWRRLVGWYVRRWIVREWCGLRTRLWWWDYKRRLREIVGNERG